MLYKSDTCGRSESEAYDFEVLSENATGISCKSGIVTIPKENYGHLAVNEAEYILMKYMKVDRNNAEMPQTILLQAKRVNNHVRISGPYKNHIFDDGNTAYLDLLQNPRSGA